jgi:hypothetical protein
MRCTIQHKRASFSFVTTKGGRRKEEKGTDLDGHDQEGFEGVAAELGALLHLLLPCQELAVVALQFELRLQRLVVIVYVLLVHLDERHLQRKSAVNLEQKALEASKTRYRRRTKASNVRPRQEDGFQFSTIGRKSWSNEMA